MRIPVALVILAALAASPVPAQAPETALKPAATGPAKFKPARRSTLIDINFATKEQLEALPQIGRARAEAIMRSRPYKGKEEFRRSKVIPANAYNAIKRKIAVGQQF